MLKNDLGGSEDQLENPIIRGGYVRLINQDFHEADSTKVS